MTVALTRAFLMGARVELVCKTIRRVFWLVLSVLVLFVGLLQGVTGSAYYSVMKYDYASVDSPPVILQNGTAGESTIYTNNTSGKVSVKPSDYVDDNYCDVDFSMDKGTHSNFPAQQAGPDSTYDTLTEENTEGIEDYVDNISNVDASSDVGTHSNFSNMILKDGNYDVLGEVCSAVAYVNSAESYSGIGQNSHSFYYSLQTASGNDRLVVVTVSAEDGQTGYATSVRFNNQEMRNVANITVGTGYSEYVGLWYFLDSDLPTSAGGYSVAATFSEAIEREIYIAVAEYTGAKQSVPDDYGANSLISSGSISVTLTSTADGSVVVAGAGQSGTNSWGDTNNIVNLQTQLLTSSGSALGHHTNVDSGDITVGWNNLNTREGMVAAVWQPAGNDYGLDLEVQWINVIDFLPTEKLSIYTAELGDEDLKIDYWNGTAWENLATDLNAFSCNYYTVSLTSTTFTIRFKDGTESIDTTRNYWQIDASLLRVEGAGSKEDTVDNDTSDVDGSADVGTLSSFDNMKTQDGMATLTECAVNQTVWLWQEDTSGYTATSSFETFEFWSSWTTNSTTSGTITKIGIYAFANPGNSPQVKLGIYDDSGGVPNNLLGQSNNATITGAGWLDLDIVGGGVNISANTTYHIAHITNIAPTNQWRYYKAATPTSRFRSPKPAWPNLFSPAGTTTVSATYRYGAYRVGYVIPYCRLDQEVQWAGIPHSLPNEELCIYAGTMATEDMKVDVWNGSSWVNVISDLNESSWNNLTITSYLTSADFTIRFKGGTEEADLSQDTWQIDVALIHIWCGGGESYELNIEVQWTSVDYTLTDPELCIRTGTFSGSENIQVRVWNSTGSSWHWVMNLTADQWNNVSIVSYLTASALTVQFLGGTETGDTNQDSWNIDATFLHVWTDNSTYDYVLGVNNTATDSFQIRLKRYAASNISRLQNCNIYLRNSTNANSTQIIIENGSFNQTEGPWYNLSSLETIYIAMTSETNGTGISYIYVYLEVRIPNTTTYAQYVVAFVVT